MLPSSVLCKPLGLFCIQIMQIRQHLSGRNRPLCHINSGNYSLHCAAEHSNAKCHATPHLQSHIFGCFTQSHRSQIWNEGEQKPTLNSPLIVSLFSRSCCRNGRISSKRWSSFKSCGTPTRWSIEAATCANTQHGWVFLCVGGRLNAFQKPCSGKRMYWPANSFHLLQ